MRWTVKLVFEAVPGCSVEREVGMIERAEELSPASVGLIPFTLGETAPMDSLRVFAAVGISRYLDPAGELRPLRWAGAELPAIPAFVHRWITESRPRRLTGTRSSHGRARQG